MDYRVTIITLSDNGVKGLREDTSAPALKEAMNNVAGFEVTDMMILSDDRSGIEKALIDICDNNKADLILTTGGTGLSPRDNTPEATQAVIERNVPGIAEAMRIKSLSITPRAMLSRGICGIRGKTLIVNLPGSPKGAVENLDAILPALPHAIGILTGSEHDCARKD
ncbi:MAG: MogA/MoaB family molybdenum cofactor biosynthesis protein [Lachnospiraceae bacterium]|nr:MogA/MoaB family molybdenum cofactor biosynthesis protein [Lachnospiraceae bacterium]